MSGFWVFMLFMSSFLPLTMIAFGIHFVRHAPKEINSLYGYRTSRSMKSRETWEFAHHHFGRTWRSAGCALLPVTVLVFLFCIEKSEGEIGIAGGALCAVQVVVLILSIVPTERALRREFDEEGKRITRKI